MILSYVIEWISRAEFVNNYTAKFYKTIVKCLSPKYTETNK